MSFLDRLKREADQQRAQAEEAERVRDGRDARYKDQIEPRMRALVTYLEGLVATLVEVKPTVIAKMPIQGYGDLGAQPIWDYKLDHERRHRAFKISLNWTWRVDPERTPVVRADNVTKVKALTGIFRQIHLGGIKEEKRNAQGEILIATFHARGYIKAEMQAQISADDPVLRFSFSNANWLGISRRQVAFDRIDDTLFDRIARFLVREDDSLFTEEISEEVRQKLRGDAEVTTPPLPGELLAQSAAREIVPESAPPVASAPPRSAPTPPTPTAPAMPMAPAAAPPRPTVPAAPTLGAFAATPSGTMNNPAPQPNMDGGVIAIDESKLGLFDEPKAPPIIRFAAPSTPQPAIPVVPAAAAAPALPASGVIAFDESKLGIAGPGAGTDDDQYFKPRVLSPEPAPAESTLRVTPKPAPATPAAPTPATPAAPSAPVNAPPLPASASAPAPAKASAAPIAAPTAPRPSAPVTPAAPVAASPPVPVLAQAAATVDASATSAAMTDEARDREAALFRLRVRAMMIRLRGEGTDSDKT